jgi:hypothetical protein
MNNNCVYFAAFLHSGGVYISNALASLRLANSAETHQDARRLTARVIYDRCLFTQAGLLHQRERPAYLSFPS